MAIDSYANLQTAISSWIDSTEATLLARIPDFISLFETRAKRIGLLRSMETLDTYSTVVNSDSLPLPAGFVSPIAAWITLAGFPKEMDRRAPQEFASYPVKSIPRYYAIDGTNILFNCPALDVYPILFRYMKSFALSNATTTNYLLEQAPDAYLFGSLAEAAPFVKDFERVTMWEQKAKRAMDEQNRVESRSRNVALRTELPGSRGRNNIFSGE